MGEEGYASLISCLVEPVEEDLKPACSWVNRYGGGGGGAGGTGKSQPLTLNHVPV